LGVEGIVSALEDSSHAEQRGQASLPPLVNRDTPIVHAEGLAKTYGGVEALLPSDFAVSRGAIHGLVGKNGAGKSTLVKMIAGAVTPSSGRIFFQNRDVTGTTLVERRKMGIRLLTQDSEIVPDLSVAENLMMSNLSRGKGLIDWQDVRLRAHEILESHYVDIPVDALAGSLSIPDQRMLGIVKTLADEGQLAMLDEPTTSLTEAERRSFFAWIKRLREEGQTFIFISHYIRELREICNEYTVLRDGKVVARGNDPGAVPPSQLAELVTGTDVVSFGRKVEQHPEPLLELEDFRARGGEPVSFVLGRGEILGLVGLPGSGASELARALGGLEPRDGGRVLLEGSSVEADTVTGVVDHGIVYLPRDRKGDGLFGELSVRFNLHAGRWPTRKWGFIDIPAMEQTFNKMRDRFQMTVTHSGQQVDQLSGGNQQKVLLARLVNAGPKVLILDEPTLGIDVGAKQEVHQTIDQLTHEGLGVLLLAYDTEELVQMADRALVFRGGRIVEELSGNSLNIEAVLRALGA
jgi:ABC-type sugar transport system ATPase subunit